MTYIAISRALRAAAEKSREERTKQQTVSHRDPIVATQARIAQSNPQTRR